MTSHSTCYSCCLLSTAVADKCIVSIQFSVCFWSQPSCASCFTPGRDGTEDYRMDPLTSNQADWFPLCFKVSFIILTYVYEVKIDFVNHNKTLIWRKELIMKRKKNPRWFMTPEFNFSSCTQAWLLTYPFAIKKSLNKQAIPDNVK